MKARISHKSFSQRADRRSNVHLYERDIEVQTLDELSEEIRQYVEQYKTRRRDYFDIKDFYIKPSFVYDKTDPILIGTVIQELRKYN